MHIWTVWRFFIYQAWIINFKELQNDFKKIYTRLITHLFYVLVSQTIVTKQTRLFAFSIRNLAPLDMARFRMRATFAHGAQTYAYGCECKWKSCHSLVAFCWNKTCGIGQLKIPATIPNITACVVHVSRFASGKYLYQWFWMVQWTRYDWYDNVLFHE